MTVRQKSRPVRVVVQGQGRLLRRGGARRTPLGRTLWGAAELAVTFGVVVLLLVAHQLWWTNLRAHESARREVAALEQQWNAVPAPAPASDPAQAPGDTPTMDTSDETASAGPSQREVTAPERDDLAYAVIRIPAIGVTAPVAQGISKSAILNHGYVGHYPQTAQPGQAGNFAVAGHRNTHGEPFRYINRLRAGDTVTVETATGRFVYVVEKTVPQTNPSDGSVIAPVPFSSVHPDARMTGAGAYITLTTCTPEYTSKYRLVVWGRLKSARAR
ncbi:class E sortase [Streptomyces sp. SID13666]|uniref:class E sortase n=1 Tax=unclassified Streptomyces TaxID=2593676 RepID=UPI0013C26A56|nr:MULTISPECIES: class E sortase [unclassified Streptomyces]NEA56380.1 class E sortase [Streptomyces sp. SID13666]NEA73740.1 class E sortase [Streptomyces sp. SID13588]